MRRLRRTVRVLLLALITCQAVYLCIGNAILLVVPRLVNRTPDRQQVQFLAFSPFPGLVLVRDFQMLGQDRFVQWQLDIKSARLWVDVKEIRNRTFDVERVNAHGVRFKLRRKLLPEEVTPAIVDAQPPIPGFGSGVALRQDDAFPPNPIPPKPWTVRMDDVRANGEELWLDTVRYEGPLKAKGAWWLSLEREAEVGPAELLAFGGDLFHGDTVVANDVRGRVDAAVDVFPVREVPESLILDYVTADVDVSADVTDPGKLARKLGASKALGIDGDAAHLAIAGRLDHGRLMTGTQCEIDVPRAWMKLGDLRASGRARTTCRVDEDGALDVVVDGSQLKLTDPVRNDVFVEGATVKLTAQVPEGDVRAIEPPKSASLKLSGARIPDLSVLDTIIPAPVDLDVLGGSARIDGNLRVNLLRGTGAGTVGVKMQDVALRQEKDALRGDVDVRLKLAGVTPEFRRVTLDGSSIEIRDMHVTSKKGVEPWSGEVEIPKGSLNLDRREIFRGTLTAAFNDARPLFRSLLERAETPRIAVRLFTPNHLRGTAKLGLGPGWVRLDDLSARVGRTKVNAVARMTPDENKAAAHLSSGLLSAGIELRNDGTNLKVFASKRWFNDRAHQVTSRGDG